MPPAGNKPGLTCETTINAASPAASAPATIARPRQRLTRPARSITSALGIARGGVAGGGVSGAVALTSGFISGSDTGAGGSGRLVGRQ